MDKAQLKFIPLMVPDIREEDIASVTEVLQSGMLIQGAHVLKLEEHLKVVTGCSQAAAVSNGTATMHLSLLAMGIGPGDEVIVPAFSYVATANVVELVGATPVFVDIDLSTYNIDTQKVEAAITSRTKAIIPVHEFGLACDISKVIEIAKKNNLFVIEDAACALGATENNKPVGSFGDAGSFSLHPRKAITSGEGGVVTTNNPSLASKIRILRNHGIDDSSGKMEFIEAGYNYRMTDFQAALVNSQFNRLDLSFAKKQSYAQIYFNEINSQRVSLPAIPAGKKHTWQTFHIVLNDTIDRDNLILKMKENGIGANYGAQCIPSQKFYQRKYSLDCSARFPNALKAFKQGLALPLYDKLSEADVYYISKTLNTFLS